MIDFKKYSNPEIVGHIAAVMASPQRAPMRIFKYGAIFALIGVATILFPDNTESGIGKVMKDKIESLAS